MYDRAMMRILLSFLLSLTLGLASVGMAIARTDGGLSRQITICSGQGTAVISIDANGNPVGTPHHCPDCLTGVTMALPPVDIVGEAKRAKGLLPSPVSGRAPPALARLAPRAQGPPFSV